MSDWKELQKAFEHRRREFSEPFHPALNPVVKSHLINAVLTTDMCMVTSMELDKVQCEVIKTHDKFIKRSEERHQEFQQKSQEFERKVVLIESPEERALLFQLFQSSTEGVISTELLHLQASASIVTITTAICDAHERGLLELLKTNDPAIVQQQLADIAKTLAGLFSRGIIKVIADCVAIKETSDIRHASKNRVNATDEFLNRCKTYTQAMVQWNLLCQLCIEQFRQMILPKDVPRVSEEELLKSATDAIARRFEAIAAAQKDSAEKSTGAAAPVVSAP